MFWQTSLYIDNILHFFPRYTILFYITQYCISSFLTHFNKKEEIFNTLLIFLCECYAIRSNLWTDVDGTFFLERGLLTPVVKEDLKVGFLYILLKKLYYALVTIIDISLKIVKKKIYAI